MGIGEAILGIAVLGVGALAGFLIADAWVRGRDD